jgi:hypothetical protein
LQRQAFQPNREATEAELETTVIQQEIVEANLLLRHSATPMHLNPYPREQFQDAAETRQAASLRIQKFCSSGLAGVKPPDEQPPDQSSDCFRTIQTVSMDASGDRVQDRKHDFLP